LLAIALLSAGADALAAELYSGHGNAAGSGPDDLVLVDLDGDGLLDAALPGKTGDHVAVTLGQGDGSFGPVFTTPVGSNPSSIAAADFDGNGTLDLVTADEGVVTNLFGTITVEEPTSVSVLMGSGDGGFTAGVILDGGIRPSHVETADLDGNGTADLLVSDTIGDQLGVLLGNGDGTFQSPSWIALGGSLDKLKVADLNGDLVEDLLVVASPNVEMLLGNGDGSFTPASPLAPLIAATSTEVSDVDSDGDPDIVVFGLDPGVFSGGAFQVFLGDGTGSFTGMPSYQSLASVPQVTAMGDLDGDGLPDLTWTTDGKYFVHLGNGDGTFQGGTDYPLGGVTATALALADADSDGVADVLAVSTTAVSEAGQQFLAGRWLRFFPGMGEGRFAAALVPTDLPPSSTGISGLASGDLNGDGIADLVDSVQALGSSTPGWVGVRLGYGDGSFQAPVYTSAGVRPGHVVVAELSGDLLPDVVVANTFPPTPGVSVLLGSGGGALQTAVSHPVSMTPAAIAVGDLDGDTALDLVVARRSGADVLLGAGGGAFGAAMGVTSPYSIVTDVALADFDGDSRLDILLASPSSMVAPSNEAAVLLGNGDGTFGSALPIGVDASDVDAADFDGDGHVDIAAGAPSGSGLADVRILLGNGDGTFQAPTILPTELTLVESLVATDVDGDGVVDLIAGSNASDAYVFVGHGDGTFDRRGPFAIGESFMDLVPAHLDEDGLVDIASVARGDLDIAVLLQLAGPSAAVPALGAAGIAMLAGLVAAGARRRLHRRSVRGE
jgi:hypothetical protein